MLELKSISVEIQNSPILRKISLEIKAGELVCLVGRNGAGKTTTLRAISALVPIKSGRVIYQGNDITRLKPHQILKLGLAHVPEGRMVFSNLTVFENLQMGAYLQTNNQAVRCQLEFIYTIFPRLKERAKQIAGTLSGGEQQMLAIGRALMSQPQFLMLDEPSLGIAPLLVKTIFEKIVEINRQQKITILLVEQNANLALEISNYGYVLETGKVILQDQSESLRSNPEIRKAYLGG